LSQHGEPGGHVKEGKCYSEIGDFVFELVLICVIVLMTESVGLNHLLPL
jgi:hypothetical protein